MKNYVFLILAICACSTLTWAQDVPMPMQLKIGRFQSRALWTASPHRKAKLSPVIILIPGSGPNGPEEMMPPSATGDGQTHSLFAEFAKPFNLAGVSTLQLGKPGIEFFSSWDQKENWFYDKNLYLGLSWKDLIDNLADAVSYVRELPGVDPHRIYILAHSEGTQVAVDYARLDPSILGIVLLGYAGEDLATIIDWQLFKRSLDNFIATDVDANHDGRVDRAEAAKWPENFQWNWKSGQDSVTYQEIETSLRNDPKLIEELNQEKNFNLWKTVYNRGPIYNLTASLSQNVFVFNGTLDLQTPANESLHLAEVCREVHKKNCVVTLFPGVGHGFSKPRQPRAQPLIDATLGPVDPGFQGVLFQFGKTL